MASNRIVDALRSGRVSRREFSKLLAAAGLSVVTLPLAGGAARAAQQAVYFTWAGYDDEGFFPGYLAQHGTSPDMPVFVDADDALTKLRAGFVVDVAHPCASDIPRWREAGAVQPLDTSRITTWNDLFPDLRDTPDGMDGSTHYFVPVDWGNTSIIYRPDLVDIPEESWSLLWDERYSGRISMMNSATEVVPIAGILLGVPDPFNMTDEELAKARDLMAKQKPLNRFYWDSNTVVEQALGSGELVVATGWNSSEVTLKKQGVPVKFMNPKEGILTYVCGLVLTNNAPSPDLAYDLINAMTSPDAGLWLIEEQGYGHSNQLTFDQVSDELLADRGLPRHPEELLSRGIFYRHSANADKVITMFEEVRSGL